MSNFRQFDRDTGFLMPPSVDEWLSQRHLARFVSEVDRGDGPAGHVGELSRLGIEVLPPQGAVGPAGLWLCDEVFSSRKLELATYDSPQDTLAKVKVEAFLT